MSKQIQSLGAFNKHVTKTGRNLAGIFLIAMTIIILIQIISRYIFNSPFGWTEELSKALMVWTAFLVAPWSYRAGALVSIDFFAEAMPARFRQISGIIITLLCLWIIGILFMESLGFVLGGIGTKAASLPVPVSLFYAITPVSFASLFLVGIEHLARGIDEITRPQPPQNNKTD